MSAATQARVITAVLITGLGLFVIARQRGGGSEAAPVASVALPSPQDAIYAMLDAAREGDVGKYLEHYDGPLAASLKQSAAEQGEPRFAQYLRETNEPVKGIAVQEPQPVRDGAVKVRVEFVYQNRNEAQTFHLERQGERWRIVKLETAERVKTLVPYGSPAK